MCHPFLFIVLCVVAGAMAAEGNLTESTTESDALPRGKWTPAPNMPNWYANYGGRANLYAAGVNGKVYAMGGDDGQQQQFGVPRRDIVIYDSKTKKWSHGPNMINGAATTLTVPTSVVGDTIYLVDNQCDSSGCIGGMAYNTSATQFPYWSPLPEMISHCAIPGGYPVEPCDRLYYPTVAVGTKVYVIGGSNRDGQYLYNNMNIYDTLTKTFSLGPNMTEARYGSTAAVVGTKIYIMGGMNQPWGGPPTYPSTEEEGRKTVLKSVLVYDTATEKWSSAADMLVALAESRAASVGGMVYVMNGVSGDKHGDVVSKTQIFDPATNKWTLFKDQDECPYRSKFGVAVLDGDLYALGGRCPEEKRKGATTQMEFLNTRNVSGGGWDVFPL